MAAFGVTLSLTEKTPQQIIAYLEKMQQLQVSSVFSSLQIPGDDPGTLQDTLAQVGPLFRRQGLEFVVDVSPRTFRNFTLEQLRSWGVTSLRSTTAWNRRRLPKSPMIFASCSMPAP